MTRKASCPNFLGLESPLSDADTARFHILPVPYEKTVTWGKGTSEGPAAILDASLQVELYDGTSVPAETGIHTCSPLDCSSPPREVLDTISRSVSEIMKRKKVPALLGGEHTITLAAVEAVASFLGHDFGVVQLDAHADLRDIYEDNPLSHACVMHRVTDLGVPVFQIGTRSLCEEEDSVRRKLEIGRLDAAEIASGCLPSDILPADFPRDIYITFDVDVFDPSIVPATGTPEPGGILWYDVLEILRRVTADRNVIGFDVVELAPIQCMHAPNFVVARLVYSLIACSLAPLGRGSG